MIKEIKEELCRVGKWMSREKVFTCSPVFLLESETKNAAYLEYALNDLLLALEESGIITTKSNALWTLTLGYNSEQSRMGLYDAANRFKESLEQWISHYNLLRHITQGIILIQIRRFNFLAQDAFWWKQFFQQMEQSKDSYLYFIFCEPEEAQTICEQFEKEFFLVKGEINIPTVDDYCKWLTGQMEDYGLSLRGEERQELSKILDRHRDGISYQALTIWFRAWLWKGFSAEDQTKPQVDGFAEELLTQVIEQCKPEAIGQVIGFRT